MKHTETRKTIINALLSLLEEMSFNDITVTDITRRASISRMTFYRYFATKEAVVAAYIEQMASVIQDEIARQLSHFDFHEYFRIIFQYLNQNRQLIQRVFQTDFCGEILSCLNKVFLKTPQEKFHLHLDKYRALMITGGFYNVLIEWLRSGMEESPESMAELCSQMAV